MCFFVFLCKLFNFDKVIGLDLDCGEEFVLERLYGFVIEIEKIYMFGVKLWVISDGYVFSDCIGVDDSEVDRYIVLFKDINWEVGFYFGDFDCIGFKFFVEFF